MQTMSQNKTFTFASASLRCMYVLKKDIATEPPKSSKHFKHYNETRICALI